MCADITTEKCHVHPTQKWEGIGKSIHKVIYIYVHKVIYMYTEYYGYFTWHRDVPVNQNNCLRNSSENF